MITNTNLSLILLIDDDAANNMISKIFLRKVIPGVTVVSFTDPAAGVAYIREEYAANPIPAVLMLDINMPVLSGWDVMERINKMPEETTANLTTYIVSSSINPFDKNMALTTPQVSGYIEKPFTVEMLTELFAPAVAMVG